MFLVRNAAAVCCTKDETQKLKLHFFHPKVKKLYNLLKRARPHEVNADTRKFLEDIAASCRNCHSHPSKPYRLRVSIPDEYIKLNHEFSVDLIWLRGNSLPHIVDTNTRFQNAILLKSEPAQEVWHAFFDSWSSVYIGYPNRIHSDRGYIFTSK